MICVICNLFDLICGVGILLKDRGGGAKSYSWKNKKVDHRQKERQRDRRNCGLLKLTTVYAGKLEKAKTAYFFCFVKAKNCHFFLGGGVSGP